MKNNPLITGVIIVILAAGCCLAKYLSWKSEIDKIDNTFDGYVFTKKGVVVTIITSYPNHKDSYIEEIRGTLYEFPGRATMIEDTIVPDDVQSKAYELEFRQVVWTGLFTHHIIRKKVVGAILKDVWGKKDLDYWAAR